MNFENSCWYLPPDPSEHWGWIVVTYKFLMWQYCDKCQKYSSWMTGTISLLRPSRSSSSLCWTRRTMPRRLPCFLLLSAANWKTSSTLYSLVPMWTTKRRWLILPPTQLTGRKWTSWFCLRILAQRWINYSNLPFPFSSFSLLLLFAIFFATFICASFLSKFLIVFFCDTTEKWMEHSFNFS